jgi:hypothetical protein
MCQKRRTVELLLRGHILRLDSCIRDEIESLNQGDHDAAPPVETVALCCGHGIYPKTILYRDCEGTIRDLVTDYHGDPKVLTKPELIVELERELKWQTERANTSRRIHHDNREFRVKKMQELKRILKALEAGDK